jgi:hypothetical protein
MKNVLIYGSYTAPNGVNFYTDAIGNHYVITLDSVNDELSLPFIATIRDDQFDVNGRNAQEIIMTYKDISALRNQVIAQMEVDSLNKLNKGRA